MTSSAANNPVIVAGRSDGFGGRLSAIVNALALADRLSWPFQFCWPSMRTDVEFHRIDAVEDVFSPAFLRHFIGGENPPKRLIRVENAPITRQMIDAVERGEKAGLLIAHHLGPLQTQACFTITPDEIATAFSKISFASPVRAALLAGNEFNLTQFVAVHSRRGDLVHGEARFRLFNYKFVPLAIIKIVIDRLQRQGCKVLLFSDEPTSAAMLKAEYGVKTADELRGNQFNSALERTAFDLGLMARCRKIYASESIFASLASMCGQVKVTDMLSFAQNAAVADLILQDIAERANDYPPLERAKSLQWVARQLSSTLADSERDRLLEQAIKIDPKNFSYRHLRALNFIRRARPDLADNTLREAIWHHVQETGGAVLSIAHSFPTLARQFHRFAPYAGEASYPYINAFYGVHLQQRSDYQDADACLRLAADSREPILRVLYADHLRKRGKAREAEKLLGEVLQELPPLPIAVYAMARVKDTLYGKHAAYPEFVRANELAPDDPLFASARAFFAMRCGYPDEGRRIVVPLMDNPIRNAVVANLISKTLERLGEFSRALEFASLATKLSPKTRRYRARLETLRRQ